MTVSSGGQPGPATLVAYASKMGSTREIAEVIGEVLAAGGRRVSVLPAAEVADLAPYHVVVLGSAVYLTRWRPEAVRFLRRHSAALAGKDVWLFHSGPCGPADALRQLPAPATVRKLAERAGARQPVTFGGRLDVTKAHGPLSRWVARGDLAGDWRDWERIRAWGAIVAQESILHA